MFYHRQVDHNIAAIINDYDHTLYNEENISDLSISILEKKFRKIK